MTNGSFSIKGSLSCEIYKWCMLKIAVSVGRPRSTMGPKGIVSIGRLVNITCPNGIQSQSGDLEVSQVQMIVSVGRLVHIYVLLVVSNGRLSRKFHAPSTVHCEASVKVQVFLLGSPFYCLLNYCGFYRILESPSIHTSNPSQ